MKEDSYIIDLYNECKNQTINYAQAEQLLYNVGREKRFELFIVLYDSTLKKDLITALRVFREAYCASDNIHMQIKNSQFPFDLKKFLRFVKAQGIDFLGLMNDEEKIYYNKLPNRFTIYRGINQKEYKSKELGISWSLSEEEAKNYVYFDKNNVEKGEGGLVNRFIYKIDVLTVFSVHGKSEIIYLS
ncbi:MAG TPA: hypothetical protein VK705_06510 [Ferruginibacter sp.]|jgi:hypothetical protein|nr:hypothetical protein [Ferruginibacter sp.]